MIELLQVLQKARNAILYGPPGTGKTYIARKAAAAIVEPQLQQDLTEPATISKAIDNLTFYDILALSMYLDGSKKSYSVQDLVNHRLVQARFSILPVKHPTNQVWGYLQSHADPMSKTVNYTQKAAPYLFNKDSSSRWFLVDEGRKYVEENLAEPLAMLRTRKKTQSNLEDYVRWVTFHQSYAYEDFVEGLRPVMAAEAQGEIAYEITPGTFREICGLAAQDPENKYVLIIDEINRGNIAKVFGELITLLEDDKRGNLSISLSYSKQSFTVPPNIYIIGTMNTADRSIALMDVALRRRFAFVEICPRPDLLDGVVVESEGAAVDLGALLRIINVSISKEIDRDHQIGHSYFMKIKMKQPEERAEMLDYVWNYQILPLLDEYYYSRRDRLDELLSEFQTDGDAETEEVTDSQPIGRANGVDLIDSLSRMVGN